MNDTTPPEGPTALEDRLVMTFRAKSAQLETVDEPFVGGSRLTPLAADSDRPRSGRRRRPVVLAVAATIAVLAATVAIAATRDHDSTTRTVSPDDVPRFLVPGWVPSGYTQWQQMDVTLPGGSLPAGAPPERSATAAQLFGVDGTPVVLIEVGHEGVDWAQSRTGPSAGTVHGHPATVAPKGSASGADVPPDAASVATEIDWKEGGYDIRALFSQLGADDALRMLGPATWRQPAEPASGVDPASLPGSALLDEDLTTVQPAGATRGSVAVFDYFTDPTRATTGRLSIRTTAGGSKSVYLLDWLRGQRGPDGIVETFSTGPPPGAVSEFDENWLALELPGGDEVTVYGVGPDGNGLDQSTLSRVARTAVRATSSAFDRQRAEIERRIEALPVISQVASTLGPLLVRGLDGRAVALCAQPSAGVEVCGDVAAFVHASPIVDGQFHLFRSPGLSGGPPLTVHEPGLVVSVAVDGQWYAAAASTLPMEVPPLSEGSTQSPSTSPPLGSVPLQVADNEGWHFAIAMVPAGIDVIAVTFDAMSRPECQNLTPTPTQCTVGLDVRRPT